MAYANFSNVITKEVLRARLAYATAKLLVLGDASVLTDDLLKGDIELDNKLLYDYIEHILSKNPGSIF